MDPNAYSYNQDRVSNPIPKGEGNSECLLLKPTYTKCERKHYGRCLAAWTASMVVQKNGHKMRDCPMLKEKGKMQFKLFLEVQIPMLQKNTDSMHSLLKMTKRALPI